MRPVKTDWCNFTYLGPTDDIGDLPVQIDESAGHRVVRAFYKPTAEDIEALQRGCVIVLGLHTPGTICPVSLGVESVPVTA